MSGLNAVVGGTVNADNDKTLLWRQYRERALPRKSSGENRSLSQIWRISLGGILCSLMSRLQKCTYQINMENGKVKKKIEREKTRPKTLGTVFHWEFFHCNFIIISGAYRLLPKLYFDFWTFSLLFKLYKRLKKSDFAAMSFSSYQITLT